MQPLIWTRPTNDVCMRTFRTFGFEEVDTDVTRFRKTQVNSISTCCDPNSTRLATKVQEYNFEVEVESSSVQIVNKYYLDRSTLSLKIGWAMKPFFRSLGSFMLFSGYFLHFYSMRMLLQQ